MKYKYLIIILLIGFTFGNIYAIQTYSLTFSESFQIIEVIDFKCISCGINYQITNPTGFFDTSNPLATLITTVVFPMFAIFTTIFGALYLKLRGMVIIPITLLAILLLAWRNIIPFWIGYVIAIFSALGLSYIVLELLTGRGATAT